jgi:hypothetical protein
MLDNKERRFTMGYPTKVQLISRKKTADQYYINFPTAIAEAMDFSKGETVHWEIHNRRTMILQRPDAPPSPLEKKTAP